MGSTIRPWIHSLPRISSSTGLQLLLPEEAQIWNCASGHLLSLQNTRKDTLLSLLNNSNAHQSSLPHSRQTLELLPSFEVIDQVLNTLPGSRPMTSSHPSTRVATRSARLQQPISNPPGNQEGAVVHFSVTTPEMLPGPPMVTPTVLCCLLFPASIAMPTTSHTCKNLLSTVNDPAAVNCLLTFEIESDFMIGPCYP